MYEPSLLSTNIQFEKPGLLTEVSTRLSFEFSDMTGLENESSSRTTISFLTSFGALGENFTTPETDILTSPVTKYKTIRHQENCTISHLVVIFQVRVFLDSDQ